MPASHIFVSLSSKKINSEKYCLESRLLTFGNNFDPLPTKIIFGFPEEVMFLK